jgi:TonB family protein
MRSFLFSCLACVLATGVVAAQEAPESPPVLKVSEKVMAARLLTTVTPEVQTMPKCSNRMVTLDVIIGEDGRVSSLKVLGGFEEFKKSALAAVKQWTYKPYLENGVPTSVETTVQVFYPGTGNPGPLLAPDGKGGVKGGDFLPMPPECGPPIKLKPAQPQ